MVLLVLGGNPLSPNFSKTAGNIQTPFYRIDIDSLRMFYVNFQRPICHRDFFMTVFLLIWGKTTESLFHFSNSKGVQGFLITLLPASDMPWGPSNITHTGTLTALKHWTIWYTDNAGPKGQLVVLCKNNMVTNSYLNTIKTVFFIDKNIKNAHFYQKIICQLKKIVIGIKCWFSASIKIFQKQNIFKNYQNIFNGYDFMPDFVWKKGLLSDFSIFSP